MFVYIRLTQMLDKRATKNWCLLHDDQVDNNIAGDEVDQWSKAIQAHDKLYHKEYMYERNNCAMLCQLLLNSTI